MKLKFFIPLLSLLLAPALCAAPALIPQPVEVHEQAGTFTWKAGTPIRAPAEAAAQVGLLRAAAPAGWANAIQTIRQLAPPARLGQPSADALALPCIVVKDAPRLAWRGLLLDCSRRFYTKEEVKQFIDAMALHKLNVFQWHLTDDNGWRLEIKKYPKLTSVGAWRGQDEERYGGFYTQDDAREVVAYAAARGITVVPEIEMPGHSTAALAAYPQYSNTGGPFQVMASVFIAPPDVFDVSNPETYTFFTDVLKEVAAIFPSPYIHIGGDEVNHAFWLNNPRCQAFMKAHDLKDESALQSYFNRRIQQIVTGLGRKMIGWDEILNGGLAPGATVTSWKGDGMRGLAAAKEGADVVMCPETPLYFDFSYIQNPMEAVYHYSPYPPGMTPEEARHVIGIQGCVWSDHTYSFDQAERGTYPRACALAEIAWSPLAARNYADFQNRMKTHVQRLDALGVKQHIPGSSM